MMNDMSNEEAMIRTPKFSSSPLSIFLLEFEGIKLVVFFGHIDISSLRKKCNKRSTLMLLRLCILFLSCHPSVSLIHAKQVGFATEFPSGDHSTSNLRHAEFFQLLLQKKETYQRIPEERFDIEQYVYTFSLDYSHLMRVAGGDMGLVRSK